MSGFRNEEELRHEVGLLHREGMSKRAIARALKVSRNTVRKLLVAHAKRAGVARAVLRLTMFFMAPVLHHRRMRMQRMRQGVGNQLQRPGQRA